MQVTSFQQFGPNLPKSQNRPFQLPSVEIVLANFNCATLFFIMFVCYMAKVDPLNISKASFTTWTPNIFLDCNKTCKGFEHNLVYQYVHILKHFSFCRTGDSTYDKVLSHSASYRCGSIWLCLMPSDPFRNFNLSFLQYRILAIKLSFANHSFIFEYLFR